MTFFIYNILQLAFLLLFFPLIMLFVATSRKYRRRIPARLGLGLAPKIPPRRTGAPRFWLHALSVGEVTSAVPLVAGLRRDYPDSTIIVSVTTATGRKVAKTLLAGLADSLIDSPIDLLPVVRHYLGLIDPDLYILVETDFWPNLLHCLKRRQVPALLVNGRISARSMRGYRRLDFFFRSMFGCFASLSMQTRQDRDNMLQFGVPRDKLPILGNLKFATEAAPAPSRVRDLKRLLPQGRLIFLAGSTHPEEEEVVIRCYIEARKLHPELYLMIAPRDPGRAGDVEQLAERFGLTVLRRSEDRQRTADIFLIDSIGELVQFYREADIAFVGGSLVAKGGHNPIEPAAMGVPVMFGPDMTDFSEIAEDLANAGGAWRVADGRGLTDRLLRLLEFPDERLSAGQRARRCVLAQNDILDRHLELIETLL